VFRPANQQAEGRLISARPNRQAICCFAARQGAAALGHALIQARRKQGQHAPPEAGGSFSVVRNRLASAPMLLGFSATLMRVKKKSGGLRAIARLRKAAANIRWVGSVRDFIAAVIEQDRSCALWYPGAAAA